MKRVKRSVKKNFSFEAALKSFLGHLEGSGKAHHTIQNYKWDLLRFRDFLYEQNRQARKTQELRMETLEPKDLERFYEDLKLKGQKTNTRRRKVLTAKKFVTYLSQRKKLSVEFAKKLPAPARLERTPQVVPRAEILKVIETLPSETVKDRRTKLLFWVMSETGALVSEVVRVRYSDLVRPSGKSPALLKIHGKSARDLEISKELLDELLALQKGSSSDWIFTGYNRNGTLGAPMTPRGVELLVKHHFQGKRLTPRGFRHAAVLTWYQEGISKSEIQKRLGLTSAYAFRVYDLLFEKNHSKKA